jgi:hypothetical protein
MTFIVSFVNYDKKAGLESQGYNIGASQSETSTRNSETVPHKFHLTFARWRRKCTSAIILSGRAICGNFEALAESFRSIMRWFVGSATTSFGSTRWKSNEPQTKTLKLNSYSLIFLIPYPQPQMHNAKNNESRRIFLLSFSTLCESSLHC